MPILEGTDGVQKMSKSLGNYIGIAEPPAEMFGKLMSISDDLMWRYLELLSLRGPAQLAAWRGEVAGGLNPMEIKFRLAGRWSSASTTPWPRARRARPSWRGSGGATCPTTCPRWRSTRPTGCRSPTC